MADGLPIVFLLIVKAIYLCAMCLILFALNAHPRYPFILAANRDEFYDRPASAADFWTNHPAILAGIDQQEGGTWLGLRKDGRFAAITNYRDLRNIKPNAPSRGMLTKNYLTESVSADDYLSSLQPQDAHYNGFNLLLSDDLKTIHHYANTQRMHTRITFGVHGLSNHLLDTPWQKVSSGKERLQALIEHDQLEEHNLFDLLRNDALAPYADLPDTGLAPELEHQLSAGFINISGYGTRCSTVIMVDTAGHVLFAEKSFDAQARPINTQRFRFSLGQFLG
jgi:uncharacterized protein with NRDE domain